MLVGALVTFLVVILILYLINMLPLDGRDAARTALSPGQRRRAPAGTRQGRAPRETL